MKKLGLSLVVLLILVSLFAAACGAKETEMPPTSYPTSTPRPTTTPRPTPTATLIPTPTEIPLPTPIPVGGEWELIQVHEEEDDLVTVETVNQIITVAWGVLKSTETGAKIDVWCMNTTCRVEEGMMYTFNGVLFSPCEQRYQQEFSNLSLFEG